MNYGDRIKPLLKKMCRAEIEELCERKNWSIISYDIALKYIDLIPYDKFWINELNEEDEFRPFLVAKRDDGLARITCSPNFMMHAVVLKEDRTISVEIRDSLENMKKAMKMSDSEHELQKIIKIVSGLSILKHAREFIDYKSKI